MKRYITIIPAELQQQANDYCSQFTDGGEYTFMAKLSASGLEPTTHYISNWVMTKAEEFLMKQQFAEYMVETETNDDSSLLQQLNLQRVKSDECVNC